VDHVSIGALLFLSAGTLDWHQGWIFMAVFVIGGLAVTLWVGVARSRIAQRAHGRTVPKGTGFWGQGIMALCRVRTLQANPWSVVNLVGSGGSFPDPIPRKSASRQIP